MIIGDPDQFAIESEISVAYEKASQRALGFFVLHIGSMLYGVRDAQATLLACSYDEVCRRLAARGSHSVFIGGDSDVRQLANAVAKCLFSSVDATQELEDKWHENLKDRLYSNQIVWAPDGDQAFDDGSVVLHFDLDDRVRLIAFRMTAESLPESESLTQAWIGADTFYGVLEKWRASFESEWNSLPKADVESEPANR